MVSLDLRTTLSFCWCLYCLFTYVFTSIIYKKNISYLLSPRTSLRDCRYKEKASFLVCVADIASVAQVQQRAARSLAADAERGPAKVGSAGSNIDSSLVARFANTNV